MRFLGFGKKQETHHAQRQQTPAEEAAIPKLTKENKPSTALTEENKSEILSIVRSNPEAKVMIAERYPREAAKIIIDEDGKTLLHEVVGKLEDGDVKDYSCAAAGLLILNPTSERLLAETVDDDGWSALHEAVEASAIIAKFVKL